MASFSGVTLFCRCHDFFLLCYVCFVLLRFRLDAFVETATLLSIVLRYAAAPIVTRFFGGFFPFVYSEMSLFRSISCTITAFSMCGEYALRSFLPYDVFLPYDHWLNFLHQLIM